MGNCARRCCCCKDAAARDLEAGGGDSRPRAGTVELPKRRSKEDDSDSEEFYSFDEEDISDADIHAFAPRRASIQTSFLGRAKASKPPAPPVEPKNSNRVSHFGWTWDILQMITEGKAKGKATETDTNTLATPLFIVAGACPNRMCGMQAVLFASLDGARPSQGSKAAPVDFWWVKPMQSDAARLDSQTVNRHSAGPHKNDPGRSRDVYQPLADKFSIGKDGDFVFGLDPTSGRAFIQDIHRQHEHLLLYLIWQEEWSGVMSRKKFLRGKICYEKVDTRQDAANTKPKLFARQYEISDGRIAIATDNEEQLSSHLPPDSFQLLRPGL